MTCYQADRSIWKIRRASIWKKEDFIESVFSATKKGRLFATLVQQAETSIASKPIGHEFVCNLTGFFNDVKRKNICQGADIGRRSRNESDGDETNSFRVSCF